MNATQARTRLLQLLGPKAAIRDTRRPTSPEQRARACAARKDVDARAKSALDAMEARKSELLAADPEYQLLRAAFAEVRQEQDKTPHGIEYRYSAGLTSDLFFNVVAQADTLAGLLEKVEEVEAQKKEAA